MTMRDIPGRIMEYLAKQHWPTTTEDVAAAMGVTWNTAQNNLLKLVAEGKVKYKKVGRQNQFWLVGNYKKDFLGESK
jgi:predicted ArsR family transcriptional regulator